MRYTFIALALLGLVLADCVLAGGCGATSKQLELCYSGADARLVAASMRECGGQLEGCTEAQRLEREHWAEYTRCLEEDENR